MKQENDIEKEKMLNIIIKDIKRKFDDIYYINIQNFSVNGSALYNNEKCFFKIVDNEFFIKEINGYIISYKEIPTMQILFVKYLSMCKKYLIAYKYDKNIRENSGLLNDLFVENDLKKKIDDLTIKQLNIILNTYKKIYSNKKKYLSYCPSNIFFLERVDSRLKKWYLKSFRFKNKIIINEKKFDMREIIDETINYFEKNKAKKYQCILSQGDPNTLNISTKPCFFDLATAGYNPIIGELSISIISTLIYDNYFCPKYHSESYYLHEKAIGQLKKFEPNLKFAETEKGIIINSNIKTSNIRKKYIQLYLDILQKNKITLNEDIKYFIIMRLLCVFNINKMSEQDYYYSLYLVCYFYYMVDDEVYFSLRKIINEMESV